MKALIGILLLVTFGTALAAPAADQPKPAGPAQAMPAEDKPALVIRITAADTLMLNGVQLTDQELIEKLRAAAAKDRNPKLTIKGDKDVKYQRIVDIIDLCRKAGLWDISFASDKE